MTLKRGTSTSEVIGGAAEQASKGTAWPDEEPTDPPRGRRLHLLDLRPVKVALLLQMVVIRDSRHLEASEEVALTPLELGAQTCERGLSSGELVAQTPDLEPQFLLRHGVGVTQHMRALATVPDLRFDRFNHERPPLGG